MRSTQIVTNDPGYKEFVRFCNSLRCPLCNSQLDGNISAKLATLYCVSDNSEYKIRCRPGETVPFWEEINFYYPQYQYEISSILDVNGQFITSINRYNMDASLKNRYKTLKRVFDFTGKRLMFFRSRMEEKVFLKKLKTYTIFS
jgi:hypothetical protein